MAISRVSLVLLFLLFQTSQYFSFPPSNTTRNFIVYVSKSHKPSVFSSHHHWYSSILNSFPPSPHPARILYTYSLAADGFSAHLTPDQAATLAEVPGIISVVPEQVHQLHTTHTPQFLDLSSQYGLWPNGAYGEDVIIGVLDTGVWPGHPSYNDSDMSDVPSHWKGICQTSKDFPASSCNKKLIGARSFSAGFIAYQGKTIDPTRDSDSPRDTNGHGTHTSTIAAGSSVQNAGFYEYAKGEARGIASKAKIAAYKVCWSGDCRGSDILAAMEQAIRDGVHVISYSGGPKENDTPQYDHDCLAIGAFRATKHGIIVSCSAGNGGPNSNTAVNIAPWILTVGASTVDREFPANVKLGNNRTFRGASLYTGAPLPDEKLPLVFAGHVGDAYCRMGRLDRSKVRGKIVLCDYGFITGPEKGIAVQQAGGLGMIMSNIGDDQLAHPHLIPATLVGLTAANQIYDYIRWNKYPTAKIVFSGSAVIVKSPAAPKVASFSGRGPNRWTPEILKPDVIAPGVNILAGWTGDSAPTGLVNDNRRVQFNIYSGTSMACPHVSGVAAMLRKAHPNWSPAAIKSALTTTAYISDNSGEDIGDISTGQAATPFQRGAGHVNPNIALDPGLVYDIDNDDYISYLCAIGYNSKQIAIFKGTSPPSDFCEMHNPGNPGNINYPTFSVVFKRRSSVVTYKRTVKNVGKSADAVYKVTVFNPPYVNVKVSPNRLVFSENNQKITYKITFSSTLRFERVSYGLIQWSDGPHKVSSPIAAMWEEGASIASI